MHKSRQANTQTIVCNANENIKQNAKYNKQKKLYHSIWNFSFKKRDKRTV